MNNSSFNSFCAMGNNFRKIIKASSEKVLIACEESQAVTIEFRKLGIEAYSCDIIDCSGGYPEWHIKGDAIKEAYSGKYRMMIGFPLCTHLAVSGAAWFEEKIKDGRQRQGIDFCGLGLYFIIKLQNILITKYPLSHRINYNMFGMV